MRVVWVGFRHRADINISIYLSFMLRVSVRFSVRC